MSTIKIVYANDNHEYQATCAGKMNNQSVVLKQRHTNEFTGKRSRLTKSLLLHDDGNGVRIWGPDMDIYLDYSQFTDLYHIMDAHVIATNEESPMFGPYEVRLSRKAANDRKRVDRKRKRK